MKITINFDDYLAALIGSRSYAIIDQQQATNIKSVPHYETLAIVENEAWTVNWDGKQLPQLENGLYRCWYRKDWLLCDNLVKAGMARIAAAEQERLAKRKLAVESFVKQGIPQAMAEQTVASLSTEAINALVTSFKPSAS